MCANEEQSSGFTRPDWREPEHQETARDTKRESGHGTGETKGDAGRETGQGERKGVNGDPIVDAAIMRTELARLKSERDELKSKLDSALQRIASARSLLAPLGSQPVPSVLAIREALQILR